LSSCKGLWCLARQSLSGLACLGAVVGDGEGPGASSGWPRESG